MVLLVDALASPVLKRTVITMLIDLILVVGLYIFAGNSGILSFGHISFMAVGAYTAALVTIPVATKEVILPDVPGFLARAELSPVLAGLVVAAVVALFALVISIPVMRLSGIAAALSMFAVLLIVHTVANNWEQVTRGRLTMFGLPSNAGTIPATLVCALIAMAAAYAFQESRFGLRLRASREDEVAAKAIGINVARERRIAFVLSAVFVGAGGFLFGEFIGSFNPDVFFIGITFLTIAMLVVGGMNSLAGAVIGTVVITAVAETLRRVEEGISVGSLDIPGRPGLREAGLAGVMLLILIFRPSGITGGREIPWPGALARASVGGSQLLRRFGRGDGRNPAGPPTEPPEVRDERRP
jgi:branched-chain amino acid transport system permease protein